MVETVANKIIAMVEAEEKCIAKHKANNATRNQNTENDKKNSDKA